jgi:ribosomal protein S18 acetylase RimI-like enzyme
MSFKWKVRLVRHLRIRKFRASDANRVAEIIRRCLLEVNIKDYPKKVIDSMCDYFSPQNLIELAKRRDIYVLVQSGKILGTGSLRENNVRSVYVDPDFHKMGMGRCLMKHLENLVKKNGYKTIELFSSVTAFKFYRNLGYKKISTYQDMDTGKSILMRKTL